MRQKTLLISPYSAKIQKGRNPKDYPYWESLVQKMKADGWTVWQIGVQDEVEIPGVDHFYRNQHYLRLEELLRDATVFVSVDNFFHHFAHVKGVPGVVIWSVSDPNIYSHPTHFNLLKDRKYLRGNQYGTWDMTEYNPEAFVSTEEVINAIHKCEELRNGKF